MENCTRCRKIERITDMQDSVCEDCRSIEFSDYVIAALNETTPSADSKVVFFGKVRQEAQRLGLTQHYQADSKAD